MPVEDGRVLPRGKKRHKRPSAPNSDRTKFDLWLDQQRHDRNPVTFCFAIPPTNQLPHDGGGLSADCQVVLVDRFNLLLEFPGGESWWVNKSVITGASRAE